MYMSGYQISHGSILKSIPELDIFMLSVDGKLQGPADASVNYFNSHAQVRQPKACSDSFHWPAHTAAAID